MVCGTEGIAKSAAQPPTVIAPGGGMDSMPSSGGAMRCTSVALWRSAGPTKINRKELGRDPIAKTQEGNQ